MLFVSKNVSMSNSKLTCFLDIISFIASNKPIFSAAGQTIHCAHHLKKKSKTFIFVIFFKMGKISNFILEASWIRQFMPHHHCSGDLKLNL